MRTFFTSESVTEGHPDKICDQVSDAILDEMLKQDPLSRVAVETLTTTGLIAVVGEVTTRGWVDVQNVVRRTVREIGYHDGQTGLDWQTCSVIESIHEQSPDIAQGVDEKEDHEQGAGDQGMMFGFATNETPEYMPLPIVLAHKLCRQLSKVRKEKILTYLRPDGKSQVTVEYENGKPVRVDAVVLAAQHAPHVRHDEIERDLKEHVILPVCGEWLDERSRYHVNATGRFILGGPAADSGVTGRKIMVDTYGSFARHGGGAFSGKDPTKVDRSGAYMGRYVAKNIVAAGLADKCEIQIAYVIGLTHPVSVRVETFGTNKIPEEKIAEFVSTHFDLRPAKIIEKLDLRKPIYRAVAAYGHFGRTDLDLAWEKADAVHALEQLREK